MSKRGQREILQYEKITMIPDKESGVEKHLGKGCNKRSGMNERETSCCVCASIFERLEKWGT